MIALKTILKPHTPQPKGIYMFDILFNLFTNSLDLVGALFDTSSFAAE